jgi:Fe-Mn family superoxide dismutase
MSQNKYPLPPLPYPEDALEPAIDGKTVGIHHNVHEAGYYDGLEEALDHLESTRGVQAPAKLRRRMRLGLAQAVAFNGAGAVLHKLYWENLTRQGKGGNPSPELHAQILRDFGSAEQFVEEFSDIANAIRGSGWAVLAWVPWMTRLVVLPVHDHQNEWIPGAHPLLIVDVWEHAYYLKYQAKRADYVKAIWGLINWPVVSQRFARSSLTG